MTYQVSSDDFDVRRVSRVKHNFASHADLQIDALRALALRLHKTSPKQVKFIDPGTKLDSDFVLASESFDGRTIDDVFDTIDTPGTWIAIYEAQTDPQFRTVVDEVISASRHLLDGPDRNIFDVDAYIFISKAPTLTPFHIDRENNFLLQIHGTKHTSVWHPDDREAVSEAAVEDWILLQSLENVKFDESKLSHAAFDDNLGAGEGLFMPSTSAHMTRTETESDNSEVSVTIGFVFYTDSTKRRGNIYAWNSILRRLGWTPQPPGESGVLDSIKFVFGFCAVRLLAGIGKIRMPRGL